ncbi:MAG: hypothetical protein HZA90_01165 [Verrucomicrobia bacterium]|nr:hypothetical protein [Verrucomicrobiota bacterium]
MGSLREKVEAELEQMDQALRELPGTRRVKKLSVLELGGTASLLSSLYHGVENILKQGLLAAGVALPSGAAWHRDLLQSACEHGMVSREIRDRLAPYMAFRHFFTHAYGFDLDPEQLAPLIREVRAVFGCFKREARRFVRKQATRKRPSKSSR